MLEEIFDHIPQFSLSKKNAVPDQSLSKSQIIKTSKSCDPGDLNFCNSDRDTEAKTSPRHLYFLKQLNKTTEMCYLYMSGFKIHQGTQ